MTSRPLIKYVWGWYQAIRLPRRLLSALLMAALAASGVLAMHALHPSKPAQALPGQSLAWDIARSAASAEGVQLASGAYIPGDRLVLYMRTSQPDRFTIRRWALLQIEPFAERLAKLPERETLTWVIDFGADPGQQDILNVPIRRATDPAAYQYMSAAPGLLLTNSAVHQEATAPSDLPPPALANPPAAPATPAEEEVILMTSSFDPAEVNPAAWLSLAGDWASAEGTYSQRDSSGYDFISLLDLTPQTHYRLEVRLRLGEGTMGGGLIYNAPDKATRAGAQTVDFDQQGSILRWGRYDEKGAYVYQGSLKLEKTINDGQWHTLQLITHGAESVVALDGSELGTITNTSTQGYYGLITSVTSVDFDDIAITVLPASAPNAP